MKKCLNCGSDIKEDDIYCRECGIKIESNKNYIFVNIATIIVSILLVGLVILFIASFLMTR